MFNRKIQNVAKLQYPLAGRPKDEVDTNKVIDYKKQGKSIREIAKEMGIHRSKVERTLKLSDLKTLEISMM